MQKIKLKLNVSNLNAVLQILSIYENGFKAENFAFKAVLSISDDLYTKIQRKAITERKNHKYFNYFNISFKYHEAYALEAILRHFISSSDYKNFDSYVVNTAHSVANSIHKEL